MAAEGEKMGVEVRGGDRSGRWGIATIIVLAMAARGAAAAVLQQPLESDSLSYFTMASHLAREGVLVDNFGQHAFYSAGYPLLLTPFFLLFGASVPVALAVNLLLAGLSTWLVWRIARAVGGTPIAASIAALAFALCLPAIWNATFLLKENLSTPLLLGLVLSAVRLARAEAPVRQGLIGGLCWGAGLVTGGSSLLLCAGFALALLILWRERRVFAEPLRAGLAFLLAAALIIVPWLYATDRMVGKPVLTTNGAFNLYLGNNPAATGWFVSIADTPVGPVWNAQRQALGEVGAADMLKRKAVAHIKAHPGATTLLTMRKLLYFWTPPLVSQADFAASRLQAILRVATLVQFVAILLFGLWGFADRSVSKPVRLVLAIMIGGFWLIHGAAYIIPRYRDPIMVLLIILGAIRLMDLWSRHRAPGAPMVAVAAEGE